MKNEKFFVIYYIFTFIIYIIFLPFLIFLSFKNKYKKSIPARFFLYKNPSFNEKNYHFHSCSLGETKAIKPIIERFEKVNLSVITDTGFEEAKKYENADVRFLPFEIFLPFWMKPCKALIVIEAELWYMLFFVAKRKCTKTILLNARISEKSYPKYLKFGWFYKKIFENIDLVLAQSEEDKKRLLSIGAKNIKVIGNIKTYFKPKITTKYVKTKPLLVIASTHAKEEELILKHIIPSEYQIVIAPRHPQRFDEVYSIMQKYGNVVRISKKWKMENGKWKMENGELTQPAIMENEKFELNGDLILMDKMGELVNLYAVADAVILGGSFVDNVGGHNPIEAAYFNTTIISGKYIFNQKPLYDEVEGIIICDAHEISTHLKHPKKTFVKNNVRIEDIVREVRI